MATTPHDTSRRIDQAIDSLNALWDLGLPRLHGKDADRADETGLLASRCSKRIRFLCYKTANIDAILADFNQSARQIHSEWVFKPFQERGTLPVLPQTKNLVERDFRIKHKSGVVRLSDTQRLRLQERLFQILDENYELAKMTRTYSTERTSSTSFTTAPSTPPKRSAARKQEPKTPTRQVIKASEVIVSRSEDPQLKNPLKNSTKRTLESPNGQNKRQYRQQTLSQFLPSKPAPPAHAQPNLAPAAQYTSFETAPSPAVSSVFTTPEEEDGPALSNATSMLSSQDEESQDLFPTQDVMVLDQDEDFRRSFNEACLPSTAIDPIDLVQNTPFKVQAMLPGETPFWYSWELHRLAPSTGLKPIQLDQMVRQECGKNELSAAKLYDTVKKMYHGKDQRSLPARSNLPTWMTSQNRYWDEQTNKIGYFTAALEWSEDTSQGLFRLRLNPVQLEQSCRLHRKFGADRFIVLSTPVFSTPPEKIRLLDKGHGALHEKVINFLASNQHFVAGRYWRTCFVPDEKKQAKLKKSSNTSIRIILFAETGYDMQQGAPSHLGGFVLRDGTPHPRIMLEDLMQWHIPVEANHNSPELKLFSRWSLGFSKTKPTIELRPDEFLHLPDKLGTEAVEEPGGKRARQVMNDGCALISYPLAKAIWAAYGGVGEVPSAVQGRISGAKGLWIVDYQGRFPDVSQRGFWIQVSDSQLKIKPHPQARLDADATQRTFEVLKFAQDCAETHLNRQLITVLEDRGVPRSVLRDALEEDMRSYSQSLANAMSDPQRLRLWMQEHGYSSPSEDIKILGSFPDGKQHQMKLLLESGFHPLNCEQLVVCARHLLRDHMTRYLKKMSIKLPYSTIVYCAPDPCDVLAEEEVFLGSTTPLVDPRTGFSETALDNIKILVGRNPAHLASDIQLRRAVYKHELRNYKNVILFSTRGSRSTAALLSGGDYDGDRVTCVWDPRFTEPFCGARLPQMPTQAECNMINRSSPLSDIFQGGRYDANSMPNFLQRCLSFNTRKYLLGTCSNEWEKLVYSLSRKQQSGKLSHTGAIKIAALAGYLVDSRKQGWSISEADWHAFRKTAAGRRPLSPPGYKEGKTPPKSGAPHLNVIDYLTFDVAESEKDKVLADMQGRRQQAGTYDKDLSQFWRREEAKMKMEQDELKARRLPHANVSPYGEGTPTLYDMLKGEDGLHGHITRLWETWGKLRTPPDSNFNSQRGDMKGSDYAASLQLVYEQFKAIEPKKVNQRLRLRYEEEAEEQHPFAYWTLLRASCLYTFLTGGGRSFPEWAWQVAGYDLCVLKMLRYNGKVMPMVAEIHGLLRVDTKFTKRLLERGANDDEALAEDADDDFSEEDVTMELD
ncbi:hypothetical protein A1O7_04999 [Cladophialophora yegresii CBS 114405]|uniref:RNA-dependent RNA polymerase n=1 Tax=Cladophialophora yegresii CBS 114405 TaxID=1182544 RepID=W9W8K8_9EURO|nr:uncharacterized protein A1O7_04999 [Cladophialophora yegresii CBS 114405]EXJ60846.1 hypothetical protein A1O7_04999 [Cladophialophora yegresii CBS 114405]